MNAQYEKIDRLAELAGMPADEGLSLEALELAEFWAGIDETELAVNGPET